MSVADSQRHRLDCLLFLDFAMLAFNHEYKNKPAQAKINLHAGSDPTVPFKSDAFISVSFIVSAVCK